MTEVERRVERFLAAARAAGIRITQQRLEVFREIASSLDHPDAETVFKAVHSRVPSVSLDTVYRTLWTLNDLGVVGLLGQRHERARFDANLNPHHHFVCVRCGLARDFESAELDAIQSPRQAKVFGKALSVSMEVKGVCNACAKKKAGKPGPGKPGKTKSCRGGRNEGK